MEGTLLSVDNMNTEQLALKMNLVVKGTAKMGSPIGVGDLDWVFETSEGVVALRFGWIAHVSYFDDLLATIENYPYAFLGLPDGVYEVSSSAFLGSFQNNPQSSDMLRAHRHFVYFDSHFFWQIIAHKVTIEHRSLVLD
jgi:hypothetical protein